MCEINLDTLILFDNLRKDELIKHSIVIFNQLYEKEDITNFKSEYYWIQRGLLEATESVDVDGTYWQNYICRLMAESENRFSLMCEKGKSDPNIEKIALREVEILKRLCHLNWMAVSGIFQDTESCICNMTNQSEQRELGKRDLIRRALDVNNKDALQLLKDYYKANSCGIFEKYNAFIWDEALIGVRNFDKITFEMLVGYERQKEQLIENTEFFLQGHRANNVLLYGDRGTGKSSCVKALLNRFENDKLKIISINKNHIDHLYKILETIAGRGCRFIVFIDDLSFEDTEIGYKNFKSVIDGGIEAQPSNTLIYVTTDRRNIIKETWKDRGDACEVHHTDGLQERLSLADRFGLSITFSSPDQDTYLDIVKGLAKQENLMIEERILQEEAIRWEMRQNGRSGRSAKQFIQYIQAKKFKQEEMERTV